jgi:hypothetical protein
MNPTHTKCNKLVSKLFSHLRFGLPSDFFASGFSNKIYECVISTMLRPTTGTIRLTLLDFFILVIFGEVYKLRVRRVAQSVQCLATGWTTGRSRFDPRRRRNYFPSSLCIQTGSGAHPASCTMGTGGPFPGVKRGRGVTLTTHPHLVPRL